MIGDHHARRHQVAAIAFGCAFASAKADERVRQSQPKLKFQMLESRHGKAVQEKAFARDHSRSHFGQNARNWSPAIAFEMMLLPLDWNDLDALTTLHAVIGDYDQATMKGTGIAAHSSPRSSRGSKRGRRCVEFC